MKRIFVISLFLGLLQLSNAEGIKQLAPDTLAGVQLRFNYEPDVNSTDGGPFATPIASPEYGLYITAVFQKAESYSFQSPTYVLSCFVPSLHHCQKTFVRPCQIF